VGGIDRKGGPISVLPYVVLTLTPLATRAWTMPSESAAPPGWRIFRDLNRLKSPPLLVVYSYMFSINVGAQWTQSTGCPIEERVSQAAKMADDDGGHERGGKDKI